MFSLSPLTSTIRRERERKGGSKSESESESDSHTTDRRDSTRGIVVSVQLSEEWSTGSEIQSQTCGTCGSGAVHIENGKWFGGLVGFKGRRVCFLCFVIFIYLFIFFLFSSLVLFG